MTPEEFEAEIMALEQQYNGDWEALHSKTDDLMMKVLTELGYGSGVRLLEGHERWCA